MSRIIILEVPDKCGISARGVLKTIQLHYPDVELRMSAPFSWWQKTCKEKPLCEILPAFPSKRMRDNPESFIEIIRNPKPIEERKKK